MQSSNNKTGASASPSGYSARWWKSFGPQIVVGLVAGILVGLVARNMGTQGSEANWLQVALGVVGNAYVGLLKLMIPPLILTAVVSSIANLRRLQNAAQLATQTLIWFAITALIAVAIGLAIGLLANPGAGAVVDAAKAGAPSRTGSWWAFLNQLLPGNILGMTASSSVKLVGDKAVASTQLGFNVLQLLVISIAVGIAAIKLGDRAEPLLKLVDAVGGVVQKILWWIIRLAPIGTLALLGDAVASYGWDALGSLARFSASVYVGLVLVLFVVYPLLVRLHGLSVRQYFTGVWPAVQLGFVSRSSMGTMPLTERVTERYLGVPREYAAFAVPLGATTKMDGCASIYPAISAIFIAQFYGLHLDVTQLALIALVSVLGSTATAGTTGATVMLTLTLSTVGLPLEGVGLLMAVEPIIDMGRTAINVAGQALVPTIVAKRLGILNLELYNAERTAEALAAEPSDETQSVSARVL
ncbi:dicarboxylate/amino acid:cation symporter [Undibacterium sp. TJN19]|uniref:dicarboxylate/amino acid:cation symporter n=1 Tax=Undibacterium sp. TJN19 TaxID=3413055 RepID=UPI003BF3CBBE